MVGLLAEKQWSNAKFSIREPHKVTPACRLRAKRPRPFSVGAPQEEEEGEMGGREVGGGGSGEQRGPPSNPSGMWLGRQRRARGH